MNSKTIVGAILLLLLLIFITFHAALSYAPVCKFKC